MIKSREKFDKLDMSNLVCPACEETILKEASTPGCWKCTGCARVHTVIGWFSVAERHFGKCPLCGGGLRRIKIEGIDDFLACNGCGRIHTFSRWVQLEEEQKGDS